MKLKCCCVPSALSPGRVLCYGGGGTTLTPRPGAHSIGFSRQIVRCSVLTLALTAALAFTNLSAQEGGSITGIVVDATSGEPIVDALVTVFGTFQRAQTDRTGQYTIEVAPGAVQLRARMVGFEPVTTVSYVVLPDSTIRVDFKLEPMFYEVDGVEITVERPTRASYPGARVLSKDQLPLLGNILDALKGMVPGLRVYGRREDKGVSIRGARSDVLYVIDGTVVTPPLTFRIDSAEVECVEVRSGYRAAHEFRPINGEMYGGVILIWTIGTNSPKPRQCVS